MTQHRIAVVTADVISDRMAGPAIRAWHMARVLAEHGHDVELLTTQRCDRIGEGFRCSHASGATLDALGQSVDVVIVQGDILRQSRKLRTSSTVLVVDLYDPFQLEVLEQTRGMEGLARRAAVGTAVDVINEQVRRGDFFLCASNRQRDFWFGQLAAVGRLNELTYDASPSLDALIAVVPFGVEDEPPRSTAPALRGVVPGIGAEDQIILWGGGIYNWFDPLTLIRAVHRLRSENPRVKLFFAGVTHPNPSVPEMHMSAQAQALADELGLLGKHVFFHEWIAYESRGSFLLEADVGVSTHLNHIETAFSFRTRILDYLWAGLPTVTTEGDVLGELLVGAGAGVTVPAQDVDALAEALDAVLGDDERRMRMANAARTLSDSFRWSSVLSPLVAFCADPTPSPDLASPSTAAAIARGSNLMPGQLAAGFQRAYALARRGEWHELTARLASRASGKSRVG